MHLALLECSNFFFLKRIYILNIFPQIGRILGVWCKTTWSEEEPPPVVVHQIYKLG